MSSLTDGEVGIQRHLVLCPRSRCSKWKKPWFELGYLASESMLLVRRPGHLAHSDFFWACASDLAFIRTLYAPCVKESLKCPQRGIKGRTYREME